MVVGLLLLLALGDTPDAPAIPNADILAMNEEMIQFLDATLTHNGPERKLRQLVFTIFDESFLNLTYDNTRTKTAIETFRTRNGNCLSFTTMFVAMARHIGLDARFQEVYNLPTWNKRGETVILNRHMNSVVFIPGGKALVVDFNPYSDRKWTSRKLVSDTRAIAQYYNNLGAELFSKNQRVQAVAHFQAALSLAPELSFAWSNLGVALRHTNKLAEAEQAYMKALEFNRFEQTAMVNLAGLYQHQGRHKDAARYKKKVESFRRRNPYYHYQLGEDAYKKGYFTQAVTHFRRAIRRKTAEHEFHFALAKAYAKLGEVNKAERSLTKAKEFAPDIFNANRYSQKLQRMAGTQ